MTDTVSRGGPGQGGSVQVQVPRSRSRRFRSRSRSSPEVLRSVQLTNWVGTHRSPSHTLLELKLPSRECPVATVVSDEKREPHMKAALQQGVVMGIREKEETRNVRDKLEEEDEERPNDMWGCKSNWNERFLKG